jgi:PAS domain S-box-containing protein/putative nucleotidyltransferase with HDIG domain
MFQTLQTRLNNLIKLTSRIALRNAALTALILIPALWGFDRWVTQRLYTTARATYSSQLSSYGVSLAQSVQQRLNYVTSLTGFVLGEAHHGDQIPVEEFNAFSKVLFESTRGIRNIALAPNGVAAFVYPYDENKALIGYDPSKDDRAFVRDEIQRAVDTRSVIVSLPYELIQGGNGIIARQAIFIEDKYWGLANIVLDIPPLLEDAGILPMPSEMEIAIQDQAGNVFYGNEVVFELLPVTYSVGLPEGSWEVAGIPAIGWAATYQQSLYIIRAMETFSLMLFVLVVYLVSGRQEQLKSMVELRTLELAQAAEEWVTTFDTMSDMVTIHDNEFQILRANRAAAEVFGYQPGDIVGLACFHVFHHLDCPIDNCPFHRSQTTGEQEIIDVWEPTVGKWLQIISNPLKDALGAVTGVVHVMRDITSQKQAESEIQILKEFNEEIVQNLAEGIAIQDMDGYITFTNPALTAIWGFLPDEIIGKHWTEIIPSDQHDVVQSADQRRLSGTSDRYELLLVHKDGHRVPVFIGGSPRYDGEQFTGTLAVLTDITELATAKEEQKKLLADIQKRLKDLQAIYQTSQNLLRIHAPEVLAAEIIHILEEILGYEYSAVLLVDEFSEKLLPFVLSDQGKGVIFTETDKEYISQLNMKIGEGITGWVAQHGQSIRIDDVRQDDRYVAARDDLRSEMCVPMKVGERIIGVVNIESQTPAAYTESDQRVLETVAAQIAIAIANAQLFSETEQRAEELEALDSISGALSKAQNIAAAMPILLEETLKITGAPAGAICLYQSSVDRLVAIASKGWLISLQGRQLALDEGIAGQVFSSQKYRISLDFGQDPISSQPEPGIIPPGWGGICLPIQAGTQKSGVMFVSKPASQALTAQQVKLLTAVSTMAGVALHRLQLHDETVQRLENLQALHAVNQAISATTDLRVSLTILLESTLSQLGVDAAGILLYDQYSQTLEYAAGQGFHTAGYLQSQVRMGEGYAGVSALERKFIQVLDLAREEKAALKKSLITGEKFKSYWCVPLITKGKITGVLEVFARSEFTPQQSWQDLLETLAAQAAIAIADVQLFMEIQKTNMDLRMAYDATIEGWARALELRDTETEGHSRRVVDLTLKIARQMGIAGEALLHVRRGALLHDIGKMGISDEILFKPGKLTESEWAIMHQHPVYAYEMLSSISYLRPALDIPYYHHEKWDGSGYPRGIKGDQIPLSARIFAIVDVWDALLSDRLYRNAWPKEKVLDYLQEQSGQHFDPEIVLIFNELITRDEVIR